MILRVFANETNLTPNDQYTRTGQPELVDPLPDVTEVHISVLFTWGRPRADILRAMYESVYDCPVKMGGPGMKSPSGEYIPGKYISDTVSFFSRGCPNKCPWCIVPEIEGNKIVELEPVGEGRIIQDNNILAVSKNHFRKICGHLKKRPMLKFKGLEPKRLTDWHIEQLRDLRIRELWMGCDHDGEIKAAENAVRKLRKAGFHRNQVRLYCLIGYGNATIEKARRRLVKMWEAGGIPFAMLYQPLDGSRIEWPKEWRQFRREWCRPAAIRSLMKKRKA